MSVQGDIFVCNSSAITLSNTNETEILNYAAPANTPVDVIMASVSHGTPSASAKKVIWRAYKGSTAPQGSPVDETPVVTGRGTVASVGTAKSAGTAPATPGTLVWREVVNPSSGYSNPQVIGLAGSERIRITAQLAASDTIDCYARLLLRQPAIA